jgi:TonB dependent receptor
LKRLSLTPLLLLILLSVAHGQASTPLHEVNGLVVMVSDENGGAISGAGVELQGPGRSLRCETDIAGRCRFLALAGTPWRLRVEKEGFYLFVLPAVQTSGSLEVTLAHEQEVHETVNVVESPPSIDPARVASHEQLSAIDIVNIPYPNTRDYRYALGFLPGVVLDQNAQPHLAGGETYQTLMLIDGFNVTQPANGQLLARVSTDAIRNIFVEASRVSAQYGKGPAGVMGIETGIGDDHFRFIATDFIPSVQNKKGWRLDKVDPRVTFSGPIQKNRIWFFDGLDGEYDNVVIPELPNGEDTDNIWRFSNLAKVQANVTTHDIVSASFLVNRLHDEHQGFTTLAPATTRPVDDENLYFVSAKEQHAFSSDSLLEAGIAFSQYGLNQVPLGNQPYVITPQIIMGNYYLEAHTIARRSQGMVNLYLPKDWHGRHEFLIGADVERLSYDQMFNRRPLTTTRNCPQPSPGSPPCDPIALRTIFFGGGPSATYNLETSGYLQDRWSIASRLLLEPGIRFDWDEIVRQPVFAPRLAGTYVLDSSGNTKISAGIGILYAATNLSLIAAPFAGSRLDTFFSVQGVPQVFFSTFSVDRNQLLVPRFLNWSVALERKLPRQVFLKSEFIDRNGVHDFVYNTPGGMGGTNFLLQNTRTDQFYAFILNMRRTFWKRYIVTASYVRSSSQSNQVIDYSLDNPVLSPQVAGPYPWDAPNRFISWGYLPLVKGFDAGYSFEAHTGFPFDVVNDQQQIVKPPGAYRFPTYIALNFHLEKRFHAAGFYWALRGGFDNITNRQNPFTVNNDINSPQFLTFSNFDRRAFTARIRFLGRK